jgi:hypothetical protein
MRGGGIVSDLLPSLPSTHRWSEYQTGRITASYAPIDLKR